jgi:hypothetical protein
LAIAPVALAKAVHNVYPVRRDSKDDSKNSDSKNNNGKGSNLNIIEAQSTEIIIIWENGGGGQATTTVNSAITVTTTVTANANAATTVGTQTIEAGATSVVAGVAATHSVSLSTFASCLQNSMY